MSKLSSPPQLQATFSGMVQKIKGSAKKNMSDLKEAKVVSLKNRKVPKLKMHVYCHLQESLHMTWNVLKCEFCVVLGEA